MRATLIPALVALAYCLASAAWILMGLRAPWADALGPGADPVMLASLSYLLPLFAIVVLAVLARYLAGAGGSAPGADRAMCRWILLFSVLIAIGVVSLAGEAWELILPTQHLKITVLSMLAVSTPILLTYARSSDPAEV